MAKARMDLHAFVGKALDRQTRCISVKGLSGIRSRDMGHDSARSRCRLSHRGPHKDVVPSHEVHGRCGRAWTCSPKRVRHARAAASSSGYSALLRIAANIGSVSIAEAPQ